MTAHDEGWNYVRTFTFLVCVLLHITLIKIKRELEESMIFLLNFTYLYVSFDLTKH